MNNFLDTIIGGIEDKKEWRAMKARAKALPEEYRIVYDEIEQYIFEGGSGILGTTDPFKRLVDMFEEGAANGKHVLEITGDDVVAFVDEFMRGEEPMEDYREKLRRELNQNIAKKLKK